MADIMTRWMRGYRRHEVTSKRVARLQSVDGEYLVPTVPGETSQWPSRDAFITAQKESEDLPSDCPGDEDGLRRLNGNIFIPEANDDLKLKLLTVSHAGQLT